VNEDAVVDHFEGWLRHQPNVVNIQRNQLVITGGLEADLLAFNSAGEAVFIVECKGSTGVTGLSQGLGQTYQYFHEKSAGQRTRRAEVALAVPGDTASSLNRLVVPKGVKVFFVADNGNVSERIRRRGHPAQIELQLPNTFYIRDCEINHFKDILKIIDDIGRRNTGVISERKITEQIGRKRPTIAAAGYNHLITLRSIGVLGATNRLTPKGYELVALIEISDESFQRAMSNYFYCFLVNVLNAVLAIAVEKRSSLQSIPTTHKEISRKICDVWGQTVRFMYDYRTVGTVMRILRELGAVDFDKSKVSLKKLVHPTYLP
jgi:hypothetical protein